MPYKVTQDGATVLTSRGELTDANGAPNGQYDHSGHVYLKGAVLPDEAVSPVHKKLLEEGDEHTSSFLEKVDDEEVNTLLEEMTPEQKELYDRAAEEARLGPAPLDYGVTGATAAPGVTDPAAAAEKAQAEAAEGYVPGTDGVKAEDLAGDALEQQEGSAKAKKAASQKQGTSGGAEAPAEDASGSSEVTGEGDKPSSAKKKEG